MKDPIQKYFQAGTIQWMTHPPMDYSILESVKTICCDEYSSILEITHIEDQDAKDRVRDMLIQGHMKVCYGAQPRLLGSKLNPNDLDKEGRKKAEAVLIDSIDGVGYMGVKGIVFLAGKWESETKDQAYAQFLGTIRAVCSYAVSKKMMVELEVFDFDMNEAALIEPASYAARLIADICTTYNNFGLLVDLPHFPITYETSRFAIQTLCSCITHLHIGNVVVREGCEVYGDQHLRFGFPESANDTIQLVNFFTVLREESFFNKEEPYVLSLEVEPWAGEGGDTILVNTEWAINRAWVLVENEA